MPSLGLSAEQGKSISRKSIYDKRDPGSLTEGRKYLETKPRSASQMGQMRNYEVYVGAVVLGALTGMRSMAAPAVLGRLSQRGTLDGVKGPLAIVTSSRFAPTTGLMAVGELVADKLPFTPNRTAAGPLLGRAFIGSVSGAVICSSQKRSAWLGAFLGAAAAMGAAYGAYYLRKNIVKNSKIPDTIVGLAEDALVGAVGVALTSKLSA